MLPDKEGEIDPNNHDLKPHAAKAATCTEKGWNEYNACSRCNYTTIRGASRAEP